MLQERWPPWKAGLYDLKVVSPWGHYFWTGGLAYDNYCYDSKLKVLSNELTLVLRDTRELDRVPNTK